MDEADVTTTCEVIHLPKPRVLIAEDESLTALDIAATVRETGARCWVPLPVSAVHPTERWPD